MIPQRIFAEEWEINDRLQPFGVTREELLAVVRAVVAARADATADDPASAEGLFAYIFGTRHLRGLLRSKGWNRHREENIEAVKHPTLPMSVVYQSVDIAASKWHAPRAVSGKGSGADRIVDSAQGTLGLEETETAATEREVVNAGVWFFCVSVNGDDVRAELSLPTKISQGNFDSFIERIFIVGEGEWSGIEISRSAPSDAVEFEPDVKRKSRK